MELSVKAILFLRSLRAEALEGTERLSVLHLEAARRAFRTPKL